MIIYAALILAKLSTAYHQEAIFNHREYNNSRFLAAFEIYSITAT